MTYDFAAALVRGLAGHVRQVRVDRLVEGTYIATVEVEGPLGARSVDARPSDALNLAAITDARVCVASELVDDFEMMQDDDSAEARLLRLALTVPNMRIARTTERDLLLRRTLAELRRPASLQVSGPARLSAGDRDYPPIPGSSGTQRARHLRGISGTWLPSCPALPCGLAADAEPVSDLGPGVALGAQALDRLSDGVVHLVGEPGHEAECFDVAVRNAAAVGAQDAPDELPVLDAPPSPF
jgi:bifunctional DNase/RNase